MSEEGKDIAKYEKVKQHLRENKKAYLIGVGCSISCFAAGYILRGRPEVVNIVDVFNLKYKSPTTSIILNALGDPGNVVQNPITKETWPSQGALARSLKVSPALVSAYFSGRIPNLKGKQYDIIGKAGHPLA